MTTLDALSANHVAVPSPQAVSQRLKAPAPLANVTQGTMDPASFVMCARIATRRSPVSGRQC